MSNRESLRELQGRLASRMQAVLTEAPVQSWLAVECAGSGLLFPLQQAGEIFSVGNVLPVPHTQPWFAGVANLRGGLHGVVDLATFLGLRADPGGAAAVAPREGGRLIAMNAALRALCALRVDQLAGLRHRDEMTAAPADAQRPAFAGGVWRDAHGRLWHEIDLAELAASEAFLSIAEPVAG